MIILNITKVRDQIPGQAKVVVEAEVGEAEVGEVEAEVGEVEAAGVEAEAVATKETKDADLEANISNGIIAAKRLRTVMF